METRLLYLFTRTPLHVGAGTSVGAIDQPVQRERHTGLPIIPGSTLKGVFADEWTVVVDEPENDPNQPGQKRNVRKAKATPDRDWLFGKEAGGGELTAGALQFGEARVLAFPVRSARGSFAWLTCPLMLRRAARDGVLRDPQGKALSFKEEAFSQLDGRSGDEHALFADAGPLGLEATTGNEKLKQVVLEEYTFTHKRELPPGVGEALQRLLPDDDVWKEITTRLVILSDGMMSFFATTACEVAQHVRIDDATGTADGGGLFNQENVPSETLLYAVLRAVDERGKELTDEMRQSRPPRAASDAFTEFGEKVSSCPVFQFGGDASTGLGYCTVRLDSPASATPAQP